jgi:hypothetical protein
MILGSATFQKFFKDADRGLSEVRTEKSYSVNKSDTRSTANEAGRNAQLTGERSPSVLICFSIGFM